MPVNRLAVILAVICTFLSVPTVCIWSSEKIYNVTDHDQSKGNKSAEILFSSVESGKWEIWGINSAGGDPSQLTHMQQEMHYPAWSSDHKKFVCATNEKNIWIGVPGESVVEKLNNIPDNCNHPAWSPTGNRIAMSCYTFENRKEDSDIWIYDLSKGKAEKLARLENIQSFPAWSPDGKHLVFTSGYRVSSSQVVEELWIINSDGTEPRPVVEDGGYAIQPAWSPDGKRIAFASNRSGNMDIWMVELDGNKVRQLTIDPSADTDPSWSLDGSEIVFTSTRTGQMQIWIMDSDGNNQKLLTGDLGAGGESMQPYWFR